MAMAMEAETKPSTIYVGKVEPSPMMERPESCDNHDVKIEVNGDLTTSDKSAGVAPLSSSSSRGSEVGSVDEGSRVKSPDEGSSSASSLSIASQDIHYASREALIERLTSDPSSSDASKPVDKEIITQLLEHIVSLKMETETLRDKNKRLNSLRTDMDDEMHTLTETLFEEAYKMVDDAKGGKMSAEKRLADATGKIDAMETEMSALKNLLTVPSSHDALSTPHKHHRSPSVKRMLKKLKNGSSSKSSKKPSASGSSSPPPMQATPLKLVEHHSAIQGECLREGQISPADFEAFQNWLDGLSESVDHPYLTAVIDVDVRPCLKFHTPEISEQVLVAVRENHLLMEALPTQEIRRCSLSGNDNVLCTHRLKLGSSEDWHDISQWCRDRIAAACDFYMYIGHIQKGIVKHDATKLYWQVRKLRAMMSLARLSLELPLDS
ncbi:guanine nucleotide exchange factor for Rab-3A-like [Halichondria panicea]|uniref:guanine nucleotide exchange factor for Rab-3A-like n=1 Tax=Halichondria panicea TaxID=6063 RepID=UPI00312B4D04